MPRKRARILAGVLWVLASVVVWVASLAGLITFVMIPAIPWLKRSGWLEVVGSAYNIVAVAGLVLIPSVVAFLAFRARLPWTGERASTHRGFEVEQRTGRAGRSL